MDFMPLDQSSGVSIQSVCVYCGMSQHIDESYRQTARDVGASLAQHGMRVVYGGGRLGLMGLVADSALQAGGKVIGVIPEHLRAREVQHTGLTELIVCEGLHKRKRTMFNKADAFVVLPGGFGTMDETLEILTWKYLGLHNKPIIIFNKNNYWDPLLHLIDNVIKQGFAPQECYHLYKIVLTLDEMFEALKLPTTQPMDMATRLF